MLSASSAATDVAPFEADLRAAYGEALAETPARALQLARGSCQASGRSEAFERALAVARLLLVQGADPETIAAALISQAIPDAELDLEGIQQAFGPELAMLLRGLTRAGRIESLNAPGADLEQLRKMLLAIAEDVRVVLIKLAERVVYLRGITKADEALRRAAGQQTLELFAPLANRLGVSDMKWELEDFAFRFMEPDVYRKIAQLLDEKRNDREAYIQRVIAFLTQALSAMGVEARIQGRPKHIYSIWKKMRGKEVSFEGLYDIRAVRVIVSNVRECYTVLGVVHDLWTPVEGEFDDYIASPKSNSYRSLHTAVIGPEGKTLEVQIRTQEMHEQSEHGVAAHWRYKEGSRSDKKFDSKIAWLRQVLAWKNEIAAGAEAKKRGLFEDTIYVLTPQGRVVDLPAGSTPIDFAYHVHTDLGHRCRGAKVDGQMVPLNYKLQNAQRVEIMAAKQGGPSRDWLAPQLGYLASARGLAKVRQWFRHEDFEEDVAEGRAALDKELHRLAVTGAAHDKVAFACGYSKLDEFLAALGRGEVTSRQIEIAVRGEAPASQAPPMVVTPAPISSRSSGVLVLGVNNLATLIAKCCKPVPPDPIVGFITRARGVTVHRQDCINITSLTPAQRDRLMPADWGNTTDAPFSADLEVVALDRQGLLRDISEAISRERINVVAVNTLSRGSHAFMRFTLQVGSADAIQRVLRQVKDVPGVDTARRL
jgi:GTP pyrophosphokinase